MNIRFSPRIAAALIVVLASGGAAADSSWNSRLLAASPTTVRAGNKTTFLSSTTGKMLSADGRFVVYATTSANVYPGQPVGDSSYKLLLRDRRDSTTSLVSHVAGQPLQPSSANSNAAALSANGRWLAYDSNGTDLVAGVTDGNGGNDVFLFDRETGQNDLVSVAVSGTATGNGSSHAIDVSDDGNRVLFESSASDLVTGGVATKQLYLRDRSAGVTVLISHTAASPTAAAAGTPTGFKLSVDGRYAVFSSFDNTMVAGANDPGSTVDAFQYDSASGAISLLSHASGDPLQAVGGTPLAAGPDLRFTLLSTSSGGLAVHSRDDLSISSLPVSVTGGGSVAMSADGRYVAFDSYENGLVPGVVDTGSTSDVFVMDRSSGLLRIVTHTAANPLQAANGFSFLVAISDDGRRVLLNSYATDLMAGQIDTHNNLDAFLCDLDTDACALASSFERHLNTASTSAAPAFAMTPDGAVAVFQSSSDNMAYGAADFNGYPDVYAYVSADGSKDLVSQAVPPPATANVQGASLWGVSRDFHWVLFTSKFGDFADHGYDDIIGIDTNDVFLGATDGSEVVLLSHVNNDPYKAVEQASSGPFPLSADGRYAAFICAGSTLVADETNPSATSGLYLYDRIARGTVLVSHLASSTTTVANTFALPNRITPDGRWLLFESQATGLVAGQVDSGTAFDVFLYDRTSNSSQLVSGAGGSATVVANGASRGVTVSDDGRYVVFNSVATDLGAGLVTSAAVGNVYQRDVVGGSQRLVSHVPGQPATAGNGTSKAIAASIDGRFVLFESLSTNLAAVADLNAVSDVFLWDRDDDSIVLVSAAASLGSTADAKATAVGLSDDGRFALYGSLASNVVAGQIVSGTGMQSYAYDRTTSTATLLSHAAGAATTTANSDATPVSISADGNCALFASGASNLSTATVGSGDVGLYRSCRDSGLSLVSRSALPVDAVAHGVSSAQSYSLSADGSRAVYSSNSAELDTAVVDTYNRVDIFIGSAAGFLFGNGFE